MSTQRLALKYVVALWESTRAPTPFIEPKVDLKLSTMDELEGFVRKKSEASRPPGQLEMHLLSE